MIESKKSNFERTVLVGIINNLQNEEKLNEFLEELEFLSLTAGGKVVRKFKQKINTPNPKTFIGKGKIDEIQNWFLEMSRGIKWNIHDMYPPGFANMTPKQPSTPYP